MLYPLFFTCVYLSHLTLLRLPYFWDEAGYYIPAAWDFFRTGTLIPVTTATNAHPPLPSILLAAWWHLSGFTPIGTRTFICMVSAAALLAVFRIARNLLGMAAAIATTLLTAIYPIWFAQSTLAHADIFAAAFTLWALSFYFDGFANARVPHVRRSDRLPWEVDPPLALLLTAVLFSLAALSKETAIVTPIAIAFYEIFLSLLARLRVPHPSQRDGWDVRLPLALLAPILPLLAWYAYHYHRTGFVFGNPEFLRYNATANLDLHRVALSLYHRLLHLLGHMNMFVPVICAVAAFLMPELPDRPRLSRPTLNAIAVILFANWIAFSILGGALLTRYLLPMYPLILLVCVAEWHRHLRPWYLLAALTAAGFLAGIWINPPYAFAPEDNLTYRDMIVLHQRAIALIAKQWPQAIVLTAWPASTELERPELGYTRRPIQAFAIQNFSFGEIEKAAADPGDYDTALLFSTKWAPPQGHVNLSHLTGRNDPANPASNPDARYFDFHEDLLPAEAARLLHGDIVWQKQIRGEWAAVLRFPRVRSAALEVPPSVGTKRIGLLPTGAPARSPRTHEVRPARR
jgi:4-amino-4-deoxy-L-arabinose transferase-like glycosyltransferase